MWTDTHCHLTSREFATDPAGVLARAAAANVARMITVATTPNDASDAMARFADNPQVFLAAGVHPHEAAKIGPAELAALEKLHHGDGVAPAWRDRIVAVGETGLDCHYDFAPADVQERVFRAQLDLAVAVGRPVVIHARKAELQVCDILAEFPALRGRVVFHCFSGGPEVAVRVAELGHWLSFTGVVTFKNADEIRTVARDWPADRLMLETDSPFLTPEPHRKVWPNEPAYVAQTGAFLAKLRGVDVAEFARQTTVNAQQFFGLNAA